MTLPRLTTARLAVAGILLVAAGVLGWLFFGFAGAKNGRMPLGSRPDGVSDAAWGARPTVERWAEPDTLRRTLADVQALPASAWSKPDPQSTGRFYVGHPAGVWLRVTWRNPTARELHGIVESEEYFMDEVDAWIDDGRGGWRHERTGEAVSAREKSIQGREAAITITLPAQGGRVAYLRFANGAPCVTGAEWWPDAEAFRRAQIRQLVAEAIYFGGLFALLGYNLVLWVRLRFADMGCYVLYLATVFVFLFLGQAQPLVFGWSLGSPGLETVLVVVLAGTGIFLVQFARIFLELAARMPRADRALRWMLAGLVVLAAGALTIPWTDYYLWMDGVAIAVALTHLTLAVIAVVAWRSGARQSRYFLAAFGCLFLGSVILTGTWLGGDQASRYAGLSGVMIGSALEMMVLSLAVANRFAEVQRRLVEETEQRRVLQEAYAGELEDEVTERTRELAEANTDKDRMLIALGHDLRSPLSALTKRAEQLRQRELSPQTAEALQGFAGEAAGEGRQMLLLIEDIVLWTRLRTGARPLANALAADGLVMPVVALHQPLATRRGVTLVADVPENLMVQTDLVLAQTMVRNLVGNAVKFARSRVEVLVRAEPGADAGTNRVSITVRDDGPGLPTAILARLRGETPGDDGGGMGLRLCQEIGAALGATLVAATPASGGTEMRMTLPTGSPVAVTVAGGAV